MEPPEEIEAPTGPPGRGEGPTHLTFRDIAALRTVAGYGGPAKLGVVSVVERLSTAYARMVAAEVLGWPVDGLAEPSLHESARLAAAWFRADALRAPEDAVRLRVGSAPRRTTLRTGPRPPPKKPPR